MQRKYADPPPQFAYIGRWCGFFMSLRGVALEFSLGGNDGTGLQGSVVQKYDYYGTRLEAGTYRIVLEMKAKDGTPYYLAREFDVE